MFIDIALIVSLVLSIFAPTQAALFLLSLTSVMETFMFFGLIERPQRETNLIEDLGGVFLGLAGIGVSFFDAMFSSL